MLLSDVCNEGSVCEVGSEVTTRHPWESGLGVEEMESLAKERHLVETGHNKPEENSVSQGTAGIGRKMLPKPRLPIRALEQRIWQHEWVCQ